MDDKVYEIIKQLKNQELISKIDDIKKDILEDKETLSLIEKFNKSKEYYEKYGYSKDLIEDKVKLMQNELIKRYLEVQNEINMLSLYINKKINEITKNTTCNK